MGSDLTAFKNCTVCGARKKLTDFTVRSKNRDGHTSRCRACKVHQVAKGQFVELGLERNDRVFVILVEYGDKASTAAGVPTAPGPLHNVQYPGQAAFTSPWSSTVQTYDATFGLEPTDPLTLPFAGSFQGTS